MSRSGVIPCAAYACRSSAARLPDVPEALLRQIVLPVVVDRPGNVPVPHLRTGLPRVLIRRPRIDQHARSRVMARRTSRQ